MTDRAALAALTAEIVVCRRCPRLVAWREQVAREKVARFRDETYWSRPVPGFGDPGARILLVGLAPAAHGGNRTGRVFTAETIVRRMERAVRRLASEGRRDGIIVKLHPDTAMYVLEEEKDLIKKLEKGIGFTIEMRDDPLLKPDEFKLVVKGAGRDITSQYAVA